MLVDSLREAAHPAQELLSLLGAKANLIYLGFATQESCPVGPGKGQGCCWHSRFFFAYISRFSA